MLICAHAWINTQPCMCGIGGAERSLPVFYNAKTRTVHALNGSGAAPSALTLELARATGGPKGGTVRPPAGL